MTDGEYTLTDFRNLSEELVDLAEKIRGHLLSMEPTGFDLTKGDYLRFFSGLDYVGASLPQLDAKGL